MNSIIKQVAFLFMASVLYLQSWAQEKVIDVNINTDKKNDWFQQPWVWVIGGAVFILLLVAILKGSRKKD